jgi:hypothetical protein
MCRYAERQTKGAARKEKNSQNRMISDFESINFWCRWPESNRHGGYPPHFEFITFKIK